MMPFEPITTKKSLLLFLFVVVLLFSPAISGCQRISAKFIGVQSMSADDLKKAINTETPPLILDVGENKHYREIHIPGAIRLTLESISGYLAEAKISHQRSIVAVCPTGWESQIAAAAIMAMGYRKVYSLVGGIENWKNRDYPLHPFPAAGSKTQIFAPPVVNISFLSQLAMTVAAFVVKPLYVLISFLVIVMLWGKKPRDLVLLRTAMVLFFIGENACTLNYLLASNASVWLEFIHGLGMVGMFFLLFWGLVVFFDERVVHYLDPEKPCVFQRHCKNCWKKEDVSCGLHRLALYLLPSLAFVALIPVTMPIRPFGISMPVFLSDVLWLKDFWNLCLEFRVYPILAALFFTISFFLVRRGRPALLTSQPPFFLALGLASYSYFRFGLLLTFNENQAWADWWEESTEFILVAMVILLLEVFKNQLGLRTPWPLNKYVKPPL